MTTMALDFLDADGPLGVTLDLENLAALTADPAAMANLQDELDQRAVAAISLRTPAAPDEIASIVAMLGEPETRGTGPMMVPGSDILLNFSATARPDDGRPRTPAFIESLHCDVMANGPAAYGVYYTRVAAPAAPMRFVDMRTAYAALADDMKARLAGVRARHTARARGPDQPAPWTMQPLLARHPRTGAPQLLLPNRRDSRLEGVPDDEAGALTAALWDHVEALPARFSVPLRDDTLLIWDNIACVHDNPAFARDRDRVAWFLNVLNARAIEPLAP
ncbi:MAG TPA: TauD/TfdA family dioxygenase [Caulobacterales bacterium]|jgi:alpha-ketoglutarate-dependent taurine dioxygenase|nr:TauD/TfdA family dioxygenase [Caulobacterales bacterium]